MFAPISYHQPLFRPPSEGRSLIFQVTLGCSWNRCAFCEMYTSKSFKVRSQEEVFSEIESMSSFAPHTERVFLADGNAMVLKTSRLLRILDKLKREFQKLRRVTAYALPSDVIRKTPDELKALYDAGLKMLYVGLESGDDELLGKINKSESQESSIEGCLLARKAGMKLSVMILNGLGGRELSYQHAVNSAQMVNKIQPEYLSTLVLSFPLGLDHFLRRYKGRFTPLNTIGLIEEMGSFISCLELEQSVFRSDHASNYLVLKGQLNRDKEVLLSQINRTLTNPENAGLRKEWQRGL
ncbi:MAG: radical SAM protein [Acidobacteria bacterium]|nr:MAG: radical SAM protein [Acidobacteriota bacterium]